MELLSWSYLLFFVGVLIAYWRTPAGRPRQALLILATSFWYVFGIWWHALAAVAMGTTAWATGRWIGSREPDRRGLPTAIGVALPILYFLFFRHASEWAGYEVTSVADLPWWAPNPLYAPIGLSFIMFESIAYQLDLYWERIERPGSWWSHMGFVLYFPTRVIGPMRKYQDFVAQLQNPAPLTPDLAAAGIRRIAIGLVKKVVIANPIGTFATFNMRPEMIEHGPVPVLVLAQYAYWVYLFFDFSGYTDIVIGVSQLLGIRVPENFNHPYRARNVSEYWQRWHMSLSFWVREYIYQPLAIRWRAHLLGPPAGAFLSMVVLGAWHGIEVRYIAFGIWHGTMLGIYMLYRERLWRRPFFRAARRTWTWTIVGWFLTMNLVIVSHIFYAAPTSEAAFLWLRRVFLGG